VVQDYYEVLVSTEDLLSKRLIAIKLMRVPGNPLINSFPWISSVEKSLCGMRAMRAPASLEGRMKTARRF
jgi:hypothetical protein